jgi:hypothetical protein
LYIRFATLLSSAMLRAEGVGSQKHHASRIAPESASLAASYRII